MPSQVLRVLLAARRGEPLEDAGHPQDLAVELLHDGLGLIEGGVARDRKPQDLPDELWPTQEVRDRVSLLDRAGRLESRRLLLEWLRGGP